MNSSHGCPSSDNSQLSGGSTRGQGLLSAQSQDEQRTSGDSVGSGQQESSLLRSTSGSSSQLTKTVSSSTTRAAARRAVRGYQSKRAELHKSRSKIAISEPAEPLPDLQQRADLQDTMPINHFPSATFETTPPSTSSSSIPIIRQSSVKEKSTSSLHEPPTRGRPLSAIEPHSVIADVLKVPGVMQLNFRDSPVAVEPLFTTITALTPSGEEEEVFREVSIGDAIDRSQGIVLSAQDNTTNSLDNTLTSRPRVGRTNFTRHVKSMHTIKLYVQFLVSFSGKYGCGVSAKCECLSHDYRHNSMFVVSCRPPTPPFPLPSHPLLPLTGWR